ncbi:MAG: sigma-70 family RNA polymerase sigma factor [Actinomycetota bacterium]
MTEEEHIDPPRGSDQRDPDGGVSLSAPGTESTKYIADSSIDFSRVVELAAKAEAAFLDGETDLILEPGDAWWFEDESSALLAAVDGRSGAYEYLFRIHKDRVERYLMRLAYRFWGSEYIHNIQGFDPVALQEICQNAALMGFGEAFATIHFFDPLRASFATYVMWRSLHYLKQEIVPNRNLQNQETAVTSKEAIDRTDFTEAVVDSEALEVSKELLNDAIMELPEKDQELISLVYFLFDGQYGAISKAAKAIGITQDAADSQLRRILKKLRKRLSTELSSELGRSDFDE